MGGDITYGKRPILVDIHSKEVSAALSAKVDKRNEDAANKMLSDKKIIDDLYRLGCVIDNSGVLSEKEEAEIAAKFEKAEKTFEERKTGFGQMIREA